MKAGLAIALAWLAAACGGTAPGAIDANGDGAAAIDARPAGDGGAGAIACGPLSAPASCPLPGNACCDFAPGSGTDYCYAIGGVCEGGAAITCDGPEDCSGVERCCLKASGSTCTAGPDCAPGGSGGEIMCHVGDDAPCAPNGLCCPVGAGPSSDSPYGTCRVGACPV